MLDGILDNHTVLPIDERTTDTHGDAETIFGAYDLLGLRFAPRIRDLDRHRLYSADRARMSATTSCSPTSSAPS
jgi:TnpA family transposase